MLSLTISIFLVLLEVPQFALQLPVFLKSFYYILHLGSIPLSRPVEPVNIRRLC